jgi:hypothetical protein
MHADGGASHPVDVLIVSLGSTEGLRRADEELRDSLKRAGANVEIASALAPPATRTLMLTDLAWARAARTAASTALARPPHPGERAIIYSSTTAALLWQEPGAIRFDAPSAGNRPGRHGLWQRPLERLRLRQAPLLLPWSEGAMREAPPTTGDVLVLPVAVEHSGPPEPVRDIAAITYAANPSKKGLDRVLAAWRALRGGRESEAVLAGGAELVVAGASRAELARAGFDVAGEEGVRVVGALAAEDYRALVRRARVFVCAPRREDYGIAQLEALADGAQLVSTPAPGPYVALPIARRLDGRLVSEDLAGALRAALREPLPDYAARASDALAPFRREAIDRLVVQQLLARLRALMRQ